MAAQNSLVIFLKVPRLGRVKTRLARDLGWCRATWWYRHHVQSLVRRVGRDPRWRCVLAVADSGSDAGLDGAAVAFARGWIDVPGIAVIGQGSGNLGARMGRAFTQVPPGPVMLIGSDIPGITADHIARGFRAAGGADVVFGPAPDGGYWLVGQKRLRRQRDLFSGVRWSTPSALTDSRANVRGRSVLIDELADVDCGADFSSFYGSENP